MKTLFAALLVSLLFSSPTFASGGAGDGGGDTPLPLMACDFVDAQNPTEVISITLVSDPDDMDTPIRDIRLERIHNGSESQTVIEDVRMGIDHDPEYGFQLKFEKDGFKLEVYTGKGVPVGAAGTKYDAEVEITNSALVGRTVSKQLIPCYGRPD